MTQTLADILQAATTLDRQGDAAAAEVLYERALEIAPGHFAVLNRLALIALQTGRAERALAFIDRAIASEPRRAHAQTTRGVILRRLGRLDEAVSAYDAAIALQPDRPDTHNNRGNVLVDLGRGEEAVESFEAAIALQPDSAGFHANLANALLKLDRYADAIVSAEAAIRLDPTAVEACQHRASGLLALGEHQAALEGFEQVLALRADHRKALNNRGVALLKLGRYAEALDSLEQAAALAPDDPEVLMNIGLARLTLGRFGDGWDAYEHRWQVAGFLAMAGEPAAAWAPRLDHGLEAADLAGREVLVVAEQGMGDSLMFAGMLPDLARDARRTALLCPPRLRRLFQASFPQVEVIGEEAARAARFDRVLAMGGLGRFYRCEAGDFPARPYLSASEAARQAWIARLGGKQACLRIGLSWRGGLERTGRQARSIPLAQLGPLLARPDCEFVSLQYGDCAAELAAVNATLSRPVRAFAQAETDDFDDLAGLIMALDLVVSVQTAVIHLSGGLGAPCLAMIPHVPEWRYATAGETMPWYGSVRLFRQGQDAAWGPVIDAVAQALDVAGG